MISSDPIFVVGDVRSGSTLLRLILDSHPNIAIGPESGFMGAVEATRNIPYWRYGDGWYQRFGWTDAAFDRHLEAFYSEVFQRFAASEGKGRWGEKTPMHLWHVRALGRIFPSATFVGIVRHPGGATMSRSARWGEPFDVAAADWAAANAELLAALTELDPSRVVLCRYEDVVRDTRGVIAEVLEHVDEPWSDQVLDHPRVQEEKGAPKRVDGHTSSRQPVQDDAVGRWRRDITTEEMAVLRRCTGEVAGRLGYAIDAVDPVPLDEVPALRGTPRTAPRRVVDGRDLALLAAGIVPKGRSETVELSEEELRARLTHAETALLRLRGRRTVRYVNAFRAAQRAGSLRELGPIIRGLRRRPSLEWAPSAVSGSDPAP